MIEAVYTSETSGLKSLKNAYFEIKESSPVEISAFLMRLLESRKLMSRHVNVLKYLFFFLNGLQKKWNGDPRGVGI
jgi:hypothetical protein